MMNGLVVRACQLLAALVVLLATAGAFAEEPRIHIVRKGQTLLGIALKHGVSLQALCRVNGIDPRAHIHPNQKLKLPTPPAPPEQKKAKSPEPKQQPVKKPKAKQKARRPNKGYLTISSRMGRWEGYAILRGGKISKVARRGLEKVLASWRTGRTEPVHGRLIRMLVRISDHFGGKPIYVVSGFRPYSPRQHTKHSRHNLGRAVDFRVHGVSKEELRDYCRRLSNVGVGYYPNSSFVHLDVRSYPAYWVDVSRPGERPQYLKKRYQHAKSRKIPRGRSTKTRGKPRVIVASRRTPGH